MESNSPRTMVLEIITPDSEIFHADIEFLLARAKDGDIGILPNHIPTIVALETWPVKIKENGEERFLAVFDGFMEVTPDKVSILTNRYEEAADIDVDRAERARKRALERLQAKDPEIDVLRAVAALDRSLMRLKVAKQLDLYYRETID